MSMREIKFRAWDKDRNSMSPANTFTGWLVDTYMQFPQEHGEGFFEKLVWMQYTGLKDKNGKEIYEGDLVGSGTKAVTPWIVVRKSSWGKYVMFAERIPEGKSVMRSIQSVPKLELIGNIYENPDLLK